MTENQIKTYEYCKKDSEQISGWKERLPFKQQNHGCGSNVPPIEHRLEKIHREMYEKVICAMDEVKNKIDKIIEEL